METVQVLRSYMLQPEMVRLGEMLKERADKYADGYSLTKVRQELQREFGAAISEKQMALAWCVLEGAGVVKKMSARQEPLLPQGASDERLRRIEEAQAKIMRELGIA